MSRQLKSLNKNMETPKCQTCEDGIGVHDFYGEKLCSSCLEQSERELDRFDLYWLYKKRGKQWIDRQTKSFRSKKGRKQEKN